jgi:hypothetical protein
MPLLQVLAYADLRFGLAGLVRFGRQFESGRLDEVRPWVQPDASQAGYDGQFYVQIAMDPSLRRSDLRDACDNLGYRAQRIAMPAISYLLGLGQPSAIVQIYASINLVAWTALLFWIRSRFPLEDFRQRMLAVGILWNAGALISVSRALTDLPSLALGAFGISMLQDSTAKADDLRGPLHHHRWGVMTWAGLLLGSVSLLTKETALLGAAGFLPALPPPNEKPIASAHGKWIRQGVVCMLVLVAPLALWLAYARWQVGGNQGGFQNFTWPLAGWLEKLQADWLLAMDRFPKIPLLEMLGPFSLAIQWAYLFLFPRWQNAWWRAGIGFALLCIFLAHPVWESQTAYARVLLPMSAAFNLLWASARSGERGSHTAWFWLGNLAFFDRAAPGILVWLLWEAWFLRQQRPQRLVCP